MKIGEKVSVPVSELVPFREDECTEDKIDLAIWRIQTEGWVATLKGRRLPNRKIQIAGGHNRLPALKRLKYAGLIDVQLYEDCTEEEFGKLYLNDNSPTDNLGTRWALHAVAHAADLLGAEYSASKIGETDAKMGQ